MSPVTHRDVVGLTGSIGSGKSSAAEMFAQCGAGVVSADELARRVVAPGSTVLKKITDAFTRDILTPDGALDRKKMAAIIFSDQNKRRLLESITHPAIREQAIQDFSKLITNGLPLVIYDCPLLFETGLDALHFKAIVLVKAAPEVCLKRIVLRDAISEDQARLRLAAQLPIEHKEKRSDIILDNSTTFEHLRAQVKAAYVRLLAL